MTEPFLLTEVEVTAIGGIIVAALGMTGGALGALKYLWDRDPASARNGTLDRISDSQQAMADALVTVSSTQVEAIKATENHEERADRRHTAQMNVIEKLADTIAPRTPVGRD